MWRSARWWSRRRRVHRCHRTRCSTNWRGHRYGSPPKPSGSMSHAAVSSTGSPTRVPASPTATNGSGRPRRSASTARTCSDCTGSAPSPSPARTCSIAAMTASPPTGPHGAAQDPALSKAAPRTAIRGRAVVNGSCCSQAMRTPQTVGEHTLAPRFVIAIRNAWTPHGRIPPATGRGAAPGGTARSTGAPASRIARLIFSTLR